MSEFFGSRPIQSTRRVRVLKAGIVLLLLGATRLLAQQGLNSISSEVERVFEGAKNAVVRIQAEDEHGKLAGTGFFIDPNGTIMTAYAVGGESRDIIVEFGASRYPAERLVADPRSGVAILRLTATTPWLAIGDSDELKIASPVVTIGYPMDLSITPTFGMIGGFDLKYLNQYFSTTLIRANIAAQRGEAGAPVLNLKGEVVGILIFPIDNRTACYALPIKAAQKVRSDYTRFGEIRQGWVGVTAVDNEQTEHESKLVIRGIDENSPAHIAGLQTGDILLSIGGMKIHSTSDLPNACFFLTVDQKIPITVFRAGQEVQVDVVPTQAQPGTVTGAAYAPGYLINSDSSLRLRIEN